MTIASDLNLLGFAPVIAVLHRDRKADTEQLMECFTPQDSSTLGGAATLLIAGLGSHRRRSTDAQVPAARVYPHLGLVYGTVDRNGLSALKSDGAVRKVIAAAVPSLIRPVRSTDRAVGFGKNVTWGIAAMGIPELWAQGLTGKGVTIAHLDTGVDAGHPALDGAVRTFAEFDITGEPVDDATAHDSDLREGHGTHTAATIAGRPVRGKKVGVAPAAELCSGLVIEGGDAVARILAGMDWSVGQGARALSLSLGVRGLVPNFVELIQTLRDNNVLPVVAVGNEGPGTSRSPGNYPASLSIGAYAADGTVSDFSSSQRFRRRSQPLVPDLVGPGDDVVSAKAGGGWRTMSGSSMATPHIAGLVALLLEAKPDATVAQLERAIQRSASLGDLPRDRVNRGAVNAPKALAALV